MPRDLPRFDILVFVVVLVVVFIVRVVVFVEVIVFVEVVIECDVNVPNVAEAIHKKTEL